METQTDQELNQLEIPIIIPSYEPDEKLPGLLAELKDAGFKNIILVDDGSGISYTHLFNQAKGQYDCKVLVHSVNQGKGRALKTAFNYCLQQYPWMVGAITADSDGQHTPESILLCAKALIENQQSLILGCRCFDQADVPSRSEFGNKCTRFVMKYLAGVTVTDTQTGLRCIPKAFMERLMSVKGERFEFETNMLLEAKNTGVSIVEVPIETVYIEENKTSHFHPIKDSLKIYMIFGKFLFSSLSSSVVDLAVFTLFCYTFKNIQWKGISYLTAATIGARIISAFYNYSLNYKVVFQSENSVRATLPKYFLLAVIQMSCSALLINLLYPLFGGAEVLVKIPVDVLLFFLSFVIQREFVYSGRKKNTQKH